MDFFTSQKSDGKIWENITSRLCLLLSIRRSCKDWTRRANNELVRAARCKQSSNQSNQSIRDILVQSISGILVIIPSRVESYPIHRIMPRGIQTNRRQPNGAMRATRAKDEILSHLDAENDGSKYNTSPFISFYEWDPIALDT